MFAEFARYRIVLVTGPQRSGTTIAARMIAHDTGLAFVPEERFAVHDRDAWLGLVIDGDGLVIQCPTMCRYVDWFGRVPDIAVVLMHRDVDDIAASEKRIHWSVESRRLELARYETCEGDIAAIKYEYWESYQRPRIANAYEVHYKSLVNHPLWIPPKMRARFAPRQTEAL